MKPNTSVGTDFVLIKIVVKFVTMCRWLQILVWAFCLLSSIDTIAIQGKYKSPETITPKIIFKRLENPLFSLPKLDSSYKYLELNPLKSLTFVEEVLTELSKQIKYNKSIHGHCYYITGLININLKSYEEAANYISKARTYFDESSQENYLVNKPLAYIYELLKENGMALEHYKKFANRSISRKDTLGLIYANSGMARVFQRQRKLKKARKLNIDNLKLQKENNDKKGYAFTSNSLGQISTQENKPEEAIEYFNRAKSNTKLNSKEYLNSNYELRNIYKNDYGVEELVEFQKNEVLNSLNAKDTIGILIEGNELSNIYVQNEKWDEAIKSINDNITIAQEINDLEKLSEGYKTLSKVYTKTGEKEKALRTFEKYSKTVDSLNIQKERLLFEKIAFYQTINEKQKRIAALKKEAELNERQLEVYEKNEELQQKTIAQQSLLNYLLIALLLILITTSILIYKSAKQKKIANQLLALKSLRTQMNPHFIFNALNSVNTFIASNDERMANKYLADFSKLMRAVLENSKHDLVPLETELAIIKLYLHLEHFRFKEKFSYDFEVGSDLKPDEVEIPPMLIQPYIENAVWHGLRYKKQKGFLKLTCNRIGENIVFSIEDNGIGRLRSQAIKTKNQQSEESTGLKNIAQRLDIINDLNNTNIKVEINDANPLQEDCGTLVCINIPVK